MPEVNDRTHWPPFDDQSDWVSSDDNDGQYEEFDEDDDPVPSFADIPNKKRFNLSVHGTYTNWGPREAFRELIQNWRDAIIESNKIAPRDLCVKREATGEANGEATPPAGNTQIVYKAFSRDINSSRECLGFIRYKGQKGAGTIEISNLKAALQTKNLYLGGTSKKGRDDQAGAHGEGLKLAALVLMRSGQNHRVSGRTTGFTLTFNFNKEGCLCAEVNRIDKSKGAQQPRILPKNPVIATPVVNAHRDVQFIIGERRRARNEKGQKVQRSPVSQGDFKDWTKVALFLTVEDGDASVVSTDSGKLLTSEGLRDKLYLKGLLLSESTEYFSASMTGHPLGFGYDFASGKTNRERESLATARQESIAICRILSEALIIRPDLVGRVCDLLNSTEPRYAEAECEARFWHEDERYDKNLALMFKKVVLMFKQHLLVGEFATRWLYSGKEMEQNPSLLQMIEGMGRQPFKLTDTLWGILVKHGLVNTAEQEAQRLYEEAPKVRVLDDTCSYSMSVYRLLRACIRACPKTASMKVKFVDPGQTHLDIYISTTETGSLIRVHKRWLAMDAAVSELGLIGDIAEAEAVAYTVKRLFADVLEHLPREVFMQQGSSRLPDSHMKQECHRAEQRLVKYQQVEARIVEADGGRPGLRLEWKVNATRHDDESMIEIQLHRVSECPKLRRKLWIAADAELDQMACIPQEVQSGAQEQAAVARSTPACRVHRTNLHQGSHCESGLRAGEEYFFILTTPADPNSFVVVSNRKRVVTRPSVRPNPSASVPSIRPNPSVSAPSNSPVVPRPSVNSNASASAPVPPTPKRHQIQVPSHVRIGNKSPASISRLDGLVSRSRSESPELVNRALAPDHSHNAAQGSGATSGALNQSGQNFADGSFLRGPRLVPAHEGLLKFSFDHFEWYSAENSNNVQTYIGIAGPKDSLPDKSRKRRRID